MNRVLTTARDKFRLRVARSTPVVEIRSRRLARTNNRLDLAAAQVAHALHASGHSGTPVLEGKTCMEIGSGWVLSHSLVFHLLGARETIATDLQRLARPGNLRFAIRESSVGHIRDVLSPFTDPTELRRRIGRLFADQHYDWDFLKRCGITYEAPLDLAAGPLGRAVDFVFSESVLEHVPVGDIPAVLGNLARDLTPGAFMVHRIHLEDHRAIELDPFAFLEEHSFDSLAQSRRGNRLRPSEWMELFRAVPDLDSEVLFSWTHPDARAPSPVDPAIRYVDQDDLMACNLGVVSVKRAPHGANRER